MVVFVSNLLEMIVIDHIFAIIAWIGLSLSDLSS